MSLLVGIVQPTLIISARDDLFKTLPAAEFAASRIPGAKLIVYDTGGHLLVGHDAEVREAVHTFLNRADLSGFQQSRVRSRHLPTRIVLP